MRVILLNAILGMALLTIPFDTFSQRMGIKDLEFLIGTWKVRETNKNKTWWEETTRVAKYVLDSTYIELTSHATSSNGKVRIYLWMLHYNSGDDRFEMVSMFGNWHKVQFDILIWDRDSRKLTLRHGESIAEEFQDRFGEIIFNESFNQYIWTGENKHGDPANPSVWSYIETGIKLTD